MFSMFSFLGALLDRSKLGFEKNRHLEIKSGFHSALGSIGLIFGLIVSVIVSGLWIWWYATHPTPARFYMPDPRVEMSSDPAQPIQMVELDASTNPRMSTQRVQDWVYRSLMEAHTLNFYNADEALRDMRWIFRPDTYEAFVADMTRRKGLVDVVKDNSLEMWLTPTTDVRVIQMGQNGPYRLWKMEMKGLLTFTGSTLQPIPSREVVFFVLVEEVPTTQNPYGLSIAQISSR